MYLYMYYDYVLVLKTTYLVFRNIISKELDNLSKNYNYLKGEELYLWILETIRKVFP